MTMQAPGTVTVDPLESLNAPQVDGNTTPDNDALPFPEEGAPVDATPAAPAPAQPAAQFTWDSDDNPYRKQVAELSQRVEQFQPYIDRLTQAEQAQLTQAVDEISKKVEQASEESASPLTDQERSAVRTAISGYIEYKKQEPTIVKERLAGTAINYAFKMLGDTGTIGDLRKTAAMLMSKYDNVQAMDAYVNARIEHQRELEAAHRTTTATTRINAGVDNVTAAPPQSGALSTVEDYERAIYKGTQLTEKQWANYQALRRQRGLD